MRGFVSFLLASVVALGVIAVSSDIASAQCNVNRADASTSNSPAILQNQEFLRQLSLAQQNRAAASAATSVAAPPRIAFAPSVQAPGGASASATAGSFAVPAPAVDPVALAQALATLSQAQSIPITTLASGSSCGVARSRSVSRSNAGARLAALAALSAPRSVNVARSRSVTR